MLVRNENKVYWTAVSHGNWHMHLAATDKGLCYINAPGASFDLMSDRINRSFLQHTLVQDDNNMRPYMIQMMEYLQGHRTVFDVPVDLKGTEFQQSVWKALLEIPYGRTVSYSQIADLSGNSHAVRAVGAAIGANPLLMVIPCHRVIGKNGALTGYRGGMDTKVELLRLEGTTVSP